MNMKKLLKPTPQKERMSERKRTKINWNQVDWNLHDAAIASK